MSLSILHIQHPTFDINNNHVVFCLCVFEILSCQDFCHVISSVFFRLYIFNFNEVDFNSFSCEMISCVDMLCALANCFIVCQEYCTGIILIGFDWHLEW